MSEGGSTLNVLRVAALATLFAAVAAATMALSTDRWFSAKYGRRIVEHWHGGLWRLCRPRSFSEVQCRKYSRVNSHHFGLQDDESKSAWY